MKIVHPNQRKAFAFASEFDHRCNIFTVVSDIHTLHSFSNIATKDKSTLHVHPDAILLVVYSPFPAMVAFGSLLLPAELGVHNNNWYNFLYKQQDAWTLHFSKRICGPPTTVAKRCNYFLCQSLLTPSGGSDIPVLKTAATVLVRSYNTLWGSPVTLQLVPAVGIITFAAWGLDPAMRLSRIIFLHKSDSGWKKSASHYIMTSYLQPLMLWTGATLICRALDPIILPSAVSNAVKQRFLNFVRSLSTVLAFAYCLSSLIQQTQKFFVENKDCNDARTMGFAFAGKAVYTAVWVGAVSLFMELLGFSTHKLLTAGGLGTVLLTLAGREIFTNFLSSVMIHATRPFVVNEWIQTKIEGYEVSGTVEHVGWWSPTVVRGDDREAVHIPNHIFTLNVVRNLSQKTHWRIKTHLAISHWDINKINNIVADMRKVLSKNPQVEQQRLHRRVFLDNIDPENQALMIMVSCFVKTSHFEEYLCVKEEILLDLLTVVSHHRARLATPIRTIRKMYSEAEIESVPFGNSFLLVEPSHIVSTKDKSKDSTRVIHSINEETDSYVGAAITSKLDPDTDKFSVIHEDTTMAESFDGSSKEKVSAVSGSDTKVLKVGSLGSSDSVLNRSEKQHLNQSVVADASGETGEVNTDDVAVGDAYLNNLSVTFQENGNDNKTGSISAGSEAKMDAEKIGQSPPTLRPALEDNIVLGVALEASKRILPIEEETDCLAALVESKELAGCRNGTGSTLVGNVDKDEQISAIPSAKPGDQL